MYRRHKLKKNYFVHPTSIVEKTAKIGEGTKIWHFSHVMDEAVIGKNCKLGQNVYIGPNVVIGNNVKIQNNVSVYPAVTLQDDVFCGPSCVFTNIINPRCEYPRNDERFFRETLVKKGASIGANATIVCGHTIGRYVFIGAGAVVTKDMPDYALVYGNPARIKGWMCECGKKIEFKTKKALCKTCGKKFTKQGDSVKKI